VFLETTDVKTVYYVSETRLTFS